MIRLYDQESYSSRKIYEEDPVVESLVDFIISKDLLRIGDPENLCRFYKDIVNKDWFMALLDLREYIQVKEQAFADYEDRMAWAERIQPKPDSFLPTEQSHNIIKTFGNYKPQGGASFPKLLLYVDL